jgi:hypothetical protein
MAGLGIAAGAFEGDNARKEQAQRDQQLALQAQSLAQQQQQASMADSRARMGMAMDQQNRKAELAFGKERMGEQSRQFDAGLGMDQQRQAEQRRQFDTSTQMQTQEQQRRAQNDQFGQEQALRQNDWEDVLKTQKVKQFETEYAEIKRLATEAEEKRKAKGQMLQSWQGKMIRLALENQVVPPEVIERFNKETGNTVAQVFSDGNGGVTFKRIVKDPQTGQEMLKDIYADPDYVTTIKGEIGLATSSDPFKNRYYSDRGQAVVSKAEGSMSDVDKTEYKALSAQLTAATSSFAEPSAIQKIIEDMGKITSKYRSSQAQPDATQQGQGQQMQQQGADPRSSIRDAMPKSASQQQPQQGQRLPTSREAGKFNVTKEAQEIKDIVLNYIPKDQQQAVVAEIMKIDPTGTNPETIKMLRKRFVDPKNDEEAKRLSNSAFNRFPRM